MKNAIRHGNRCPTNGFEGFGAGGAEDCLFLNVYTPDLNGKLAVMVWIHAGSFMHSDGDDTLYSPNHLVRENVIVVSFNYRLTFFGFLTTGDQHAQGNYGLKDMVLALKWVKENIHAFGGDPEKITTFGASAGATAVHMLLLSDMSRNLFSKSIIQSGSALCPYSFRNDGRIVAEQLGKRLGLKFNSTESLVKKLRQVDYKKILEAERTYFDLDKPFGLRPFDFVPCIEPEDSLEAKFFTKDPTTLVIEQEFQRVPIIIGTTSKDGLMFIREYDFDKDVFERYNENEDFFVPVSFNLDKNSPEASEVANTFKSFYFRGENLSKSSLNDYAEFQSDAQFRVPVDRAINFLGDNSQYPIYRYVFDYCCGFNLMKNLFSLKEFSGACHLDDVFYLFSPKYPFLSGHWTTL